MLFRPIICLNGTVDLTLVHLYQFVVATEHIGNLVFIQLCHEVASWTAVFARVELARFFSEHLADGSGESQTRVTVDVDFAYGALRCAAQLLLGNADSIGQFSAILVDGVHIFLRNGYTLSA